MSDSVRPPQTAAHQAPASLRFSRQEHWSGLPFPSPMHESEKWKWSRSVVSDSGTPWAEASKGSSIHGIFQERVLEWGAIAFLLLLKVCNEGKQEFDFYWAITMCQELQDGSLREWRSEESLYSRIPALGKLHIIKEKVFALNDLVTLCSVLSDSLQPHGL